MKKILCVLVCSLFFVACGSNNNSGKSADTKATDSVKVETPACCQDSLKACCQDSLKATCCQDSLKCADCQKDGKCACEGECKGECKKAEENK